MANKRRIFAVAGEPSGDVHGAHVLRELKANSSEISVRGFGGPKMQAEGMELLEDLASDAIMGLFPVIKSLPKIRQWFRTAEDDLRNNRPDALLLIDYPGFNLRLAKIAKSMGIPVIYYISPQVWAWKEKRVEKIRQFVDLMIVILPFEVPFFAKHDVEAHYVGHPLSDRLSSEPADQTRVKELRHQKTGSPIFGLFPGSRRHVVQSLGPEFMRAAQLIRQDERLKDSRFLIAAAQSSIAHQVKSMAEFDDSLFEVVVGEPFEVMAACDLALTTSGTTTMELAGHIRPMILAYKVSPVLHAVGRMVVKVPYIGLVNLIAEDLVVPEHIGSTSLAKKLADDLIDLATNDERRNKMIEGLEEVVDRLKTPGSYQRTADLISDFISGLR